MKKLLLLVFLLVAGTVGAQEFEGSEFSFDQNEIINNDPLYSGRATPLGQFSGFQNPSRRIFSIPPVDVYNENSKETINMLAIVEAEERMKRRNIMEMEFPQNQLSQIKSSVQVYFDQTSFNNRTGNDLNFYGRQTPDGGIKNEVYQDVRQPFLNPYYRSYNNSYYRQRSGRPSFYFTR